MNIHELKNMSSTQLENLYKDLFNFFPSSNNQLFLKRTVANKLQENEAGGFPKHLGDEIQELIVRLDPINLPVLRSRRLLNKKAQDRDKRLPIPGTIITKKYKELLIEVKVLDRGFEYKGKHYRTLTAIAEEVTGSHWSGFNFFNLE